MKFAESYREEKFTLNNKKREFRRLKHNIREIWGKVHHKQSNKSRIKQERNKSTHQISKTYKKKNIKTTLNRLKNMNQQETAKKQKTQNTTRQPAQTGPVKHH
jgi:hypothetical protein